MFSQPLDNFFRIPATEVQPLVRNSIRARQDSENSIARYVRPFLLILSLTLLKLPFSVVGRDRLGTD